MSLQSSLKRAWLRRPTIQQWRLISGLVLLTFVTSHFLNHALGLVNVEVMEAAQGFRRAVWRSWPGTGLLYGAFVVHLVLAILRIAQRRTWRMPRVEALQLGFALLIPFSLVNHILATRGLNLTLGVDDRYARELRLLWPNQAVTQSFLLAVVWAHGMIGLHFWLRTKAWFPGWRDIFIIGAVLVPTLALAGWVTGGREVANIEFTRPPLDVAQLSFLSELRASGHFALAAIAILTTAIVGAQALRRLGGRRIAVTYIGGNTVRVAPGPTLLEISRENRVPHTSVCGGRARCSTCRVRVAAGEKGLAAPEKAERAVLDRIRAPPGIRLACRIRPAADLTIQLLIPAAEARGFDPGEPDGARWGIERRVTVLFADLRGFTSIAEDQFPYDIVFLLNRYLTLMTDAVEANGGQIDKFLGDGIMAIFGVSPQFGAGSRAALLAARDMEAALQSLNGEFAGALPHKLKMGVGIHMGHAVLGRVGVRGAVESMALTALGDTVNTASRLQDATKDLGAYCIVSEEAMMAADIRVREVTVHELAVRGRVQPLTVHAIGGFEGMIIGTQPEGAALPI